MQTGQPIVERADSYACRRFLEGVLFFCAEIEVWVLACQSGRRKEFSSHIGSSSTGATYATPAAAGPTAMQNVDCVACQAARSGALRHRHAGVGSDCYGGAGKLADLGGGIPRCGCLVRSAGPVRGGDPALWGTSWLRDGWQMVVSVRPSLQGQDFAEE
jgi:hypothetical protein